MSEIIKFKGRREEIRQKINQLRLRMNGDIIGLRELLDPTLPPEKLKCDVIAAQAVELGEKWSRLQEALAELDKIKELLGE